MRPLNDIIFAELITCTLHDMPPLVTNHSDSYSFCLTRYEWTLGIQVQSGKYLDLTVIRTRCTVEYATYLLGQRWLHEDLHNNYVGTYMYLTPRGRPQIRWSDEWRTLENKQVNNWEELHLIELYGVFQRRPIVCWQRLHKWWWWQT